MLFVNGSYIHSINNGAVADTKSCEFTGMHSYRFVNFIITVVK